MKTEIRRQFMHFLFGSITITMVATIGTQATIQSLITIFAIGLVVSYAIRKGLRVPGLMHIVTRVEREHEKHLPGKAALIFLAGTIATIVIFQRQEIILGALITATYGDAASTVIGLKFGRHAISGKKTLEGTLGGIGASLALLAAIYPIPIALSAAVAGMLAELLPIDDNFTIPMATGTVLHFLIPG